MHLLLVLLVIAGITPLTEWKEATEMAMRWRLEGSVTYDDGVRRDWQVVPSLTTLLLQANKEWPVSHPSDGTAAGQGHFTSNPKSDHTPDKEGDVRAGDIGEVTEDDARELAEAIRLSIDLRIKYVIHEREIFFGAGYEHLGDRVPYQWYPYTGTNGHWSHIHLSVLKSNQNDNRPWTITEGEEMVTRNDKADDGLGSLKNNFEELKAAGVFSSATQPGGITFNDEFATFLLRFEDHIVEKYRLRLEASSGLERGDVVKLV